MPKRKITRVDFVPQIQQLGKAGATKLRVAAYARVSSESEEQEHSLSAQTDYFAAFIKENPLWEYVGLYVDDGVSGLSHQKRDGFNRMVADALEGKIDLIITKSLSRFARNTVDALTTIRKLKAANVGIFFQKEDINTLDAKGEFMLTLMSSFAEEESRSISENVTWGHRKRFADGNYTVPFAQFLGYDKGKSKGEFIINEGEAKVVRFIYMLAFEHYPMSGIARLLQKLNVPSPSGNNNWQVCTVESILRNEKYKGDALLQKTFTVDFRERSKRFEFTFANDDKRNAKASETLKKYCDNFEENKKSGVGFIIHSNQNGGGKTYLACAVANELIDKGKKVLVTDFLALRDRLFKPEAYKSGASVFANKDDVIKHLLDYDLVVIDDLGVEQSTEFMLEVEYRVIDALTDALVPLILTTNYTLAEIKGSEDINKRRVLDRILGSCALLSVDTPDGKSRRVERCAELTRELTAQGAEA